MSPNLAEQVRHLPSYLGAHVVLSGLALAIGVAFSLPLAVLVAHSRRLSFPVVSTAGVIQTIPSLALLALMVPLLGAFGFRPALLALVLYSMLPILRNTVAGIAQVDPELTEAARALGMTRAQTLRLVQLPLALPVIVAGIRTAAVWVVGIATLSTPVGQTSLGNYIFGGLQTRNWTAVLFGCVAAALLAVVIDLLLALAEQGVERRSRARLLVAAGCLVLVFGAGALAPRFARATPVALAVPAGPEAALPQAKLVRVGAKTFTEQYILAALIESQLAAAGVTASRSDSLGSTVAFDALTKSEIDVYVDYSGTLWANAMKRSDVAPAWRVLAELSGWLAETHGVRYLGALGFENAYALAMRRDRSEELSIRSVEDLAGKAPELELGSDYEFFQRPEWRRLRESYGLGFRAEVSFDSTFMYEALESGRVDVITAFSSDGRIEAHDLVLLDDPRRAFPPYDAVLLLSPRVASDARVIRALSPLVGAIPVERMRQANLMVDRDHDKKSPAEAARWLWQTRVQSRR